MSSKQVRITQIRSGIRRKKDQCQTLVALGLGKIGKTKVHSVDPSIIGMIRKVEHLVKYEKV